MNSLTTEQPIDVKLEMQSIILAGMTSESDFKDAIVKLCGYYDVKSNAPKLQDVTKKFYELSIEIGSLPVDDISENKLCDLLGEALSVTSPLSTPLPLD
jgi:hypothetical protein